MQLIKKFIDGFLEKLGEFTAAAVVASLTGLAWLSFPARFTVSRWMLIALIAGVAALVYATYYWGVWRGKRRVGVPRRLAPVDSLQESILKLLWAHPHACVKFEVLVHMLHESYNTVRLACERLQARGFIAGNFYDSYTLVQLLNEGREYMDKRGLQRRAERFLLEQFQRAEAELSQPG